MLSRELFFIRQHKEWVEILTDWETHNKYEVLGVDGDVVGCIVERKGGLGSILLRGFLRSHRPLKVDVFDANLNLRYHLSRPFFWYFSDLEIRDSRGARLGSVHRRWAFLRKVYSLRDETGRVFARIESPFWRIWTFPIVGTRAKITKRWSGVLREIFTDADTYMIDYGGEAWTDSQRATIFGAAISIDFDFFENNLGR